MKRLLRGFEAAATRTHDFAPFVVVIATVLEGGPTTAELSEALVALQAQQPLLRVRIAGGRGRYHFDSTDVPPIPLAVRQRTGDGLWLEIVDAELNERIDDRTGPLMRCTYLPPAAAGGRAELLLSLHHAIVDAASGVELVDQLLARCAEGGRFDLPSAGPPVTLEERLPRRFRGLRGLGRRIGFLLRQLGDEASYRLMQRSPAGPASQTTRCHPLVVRLDREETSALVRASRRQRVTIKGALDAAFLLAVRRRLPGAGGARLRYMSFADLRPYLDPPLPASVLGGFIALLRHTIEVKDDDDFWSLARRITRQVEVAMRRGDKFTSALLADTMMRVSLGQTTHRMATVAVSYSGPAGLRPRYGSMNLRGMHGFVSNFGLGPRYTVSARLIANEILLDVVYLDSDMDRGLAESLAEDALTTLRLAATIE